MKIIYPDYKNCLTNLISSILKDFGVQPLHPALPALDKALQEKEYENIVLILSDGLGSNIMERNLEPNSFLRQHLSANITSVFPATTTASTTSLISGLNPIEHNWLGWDIFVKDIDKTVTLFTNNIKDAETPAAGYSVAKKFFPYKTVFEMINEQTDDKAFCVSPYDGQKYDREEPDKMYTIIKDLCSVPGKKYIYAYNNEPDTLMHEYGTDDDRVKCRIQYINSQIQKLCQNLENTLVIVTADHGHINVTYESLEDYPTIKRTLLRTTSIEHRATTFFVKPGFEKEFETEFSKHLGKDFILMSKQEVIDGKLFGDGKPHKNFESSVGEYMALAISNKAISFDTEVSPFKSTHAGVTEDETIVPLILIDTDKID